MTAGPGDTVDEVETVLAFHGGDLVVSGRGTAPGGARLVGPRVGTTGAVGTDAEGWSARIPLRAARWNGPELPLPSGAYRLELDGAPLPAAVVPPAIRVGLRAGYADGVVTVAAPVDPAYDAEEGQEALERRYAATLPTGLENAVFFESAEGRAVVGDPGAIDRELARLAPSLIRYWSVVDLSVAVPDGAVAVVDGSPAWWRARAAARLIVVDGALRRLFSRRAGQAVLQTGRGTPLERVGLHRRGLHPRHIAATIRESRRWDALLAPNPSAERLLRRAFAVVDRPIWVEGRPANDLLVTGDPAAARAAVGLGAGERVVLLAPAGASALARVDAAGLARATGAVIVLRRPDGAADTPDDAAAADLRMGEDGADAATGRVVDATDFPDPAVLLLAADVLVTDHATLAVDAGVRGTPVVILAPQAPRQLSLDIVEHPPGAVVDGQDALVAAVTAALAGTPDTGEAAAWRERFTALDDGGAARRVAQRILDAGWVDPA